MTFRKTFLPALILSAICLVMGAALALTNTLTKDKIASVEREKYEASAKEVLPAHTYEELKEDGIEGFVGKDANGNTVGYAIKTSARGYGGDVTCVVGINTQGVIVGLSVNAPDETPGLGIRVQEKGFLSPFLGLGINDPPVLGKNVDGVSSATYSSKAVEQAVKTALSQYEMLTKGGS